ncbi:MAG: hypothetical protein NTX62_01310, partial [Deltaproteobacteria bacterium]|nr:hypothetical protein [Deltaproteobacteria bacterium]
MKFLYLMLCLMLVAYSPLYADCIDGDCVDGIGTYVYIDGSSYEGLFLDDNRNGQGILTFPDGKILSGQFKNNCLDGHGTMIWPDGRKENVLQTNDSTFKVI